MPTTIAILKPFRRGNDLLMRGIIGNPPTNSVSVIYPFRVGNELVWRGKDCSGNVLYAWPFRDATTGELRARTVYRVCDSSTICSGLSDSIAAGLPSSVTVVVSGLYNTLPYGLCNGYPGDCSTDYTYFNKTYVLTKVTTPSCTYELSPAVSGCTGIARLQWVSAGGGYAWRFLVTSGLVINATFQAATATTLPGYSPQSGTYTYQVRILSGSPCGPASATGLSCVVS